MYKIGLFDLDTSLADFNKSLLSDLEKLRSPNEPKINNLWEAEKHPYIKNRMHLIKKQPNWWASLEPIEIGMKAFELAHSMGFNCQILTKGPNQISAAWKEKLDWVKKHIGDVVVTITGGCPDDRGLQYKSNVYGHFLYDDYPEYLEGWLKERKRGIGIMPVNEFNKDYHNDRVYKYDGNLKHLEIIFSRILKRDSMESISLDNLD